MGVMAITAFILTFHKPKAPREKHHRYYYDSLVYHKKEDSLRRAARYQAVHDSFALLKEQRLAQKRKREAAYQALMDSYAQLRLQREVKKAEREAAWNKKRDSLDALRPKKLGEGESIDLSDCDSLQLLRVPGIGSGYAHAILNYRNRLGGFYSKEQLLEIHGIPTEALAYFHIMTNNKTVKININKATLNQLRHHPYISFEQAKCIINYRNRYGVIQDIGQLRLLDEFPEKELERISHYVSY